MAKVVFTPWKTQAQLLAVRDQFYPPPTYDGPDLRSQACAKVFISSLLFILNFMLILLGIDLETTG